MGENCSAIVPPSPPCSTAPSTTVISSNAGRGAGGQSCRRNHDTARRKPAGPRRSELWGTSRKCVQGFLKGIFSNFEQEMGPPRQNQAPLASARTAVKDQSPLRGAPLVPRSASLTAFLASASALLWGSGCSPLGTRETSKTKTNSYELC